MRPSVFQEFTLVSKQPQRPSDDSVTALSSLLFEALLIIRRLPPDVKQHYSVTAAAIQLQIETPSMEI
jgi:hypothetical protein